MSSGLKCERPLGLPRMEPGSLSILPPGFSLKSPGDEYNYVWRRQGVGVGGAASAFQPQGALSQRVARAATGRQKTVGAYTSATC